MPTVLEISQPEVETPLPAAKAIPQMVGQALSFLPPAPPRTLFADSLLESGSPERPRRGLATTFSFVFQCIVVGILLIVPLMFTEALPTQQLLTFLVAPPPSPPPTASSRCACG